MKETIGLIAKSQSDLSKILTRQLNGFQTNFNHYKDRLRLVRKNGDDQIALLKEKLEDVEKEFDDYKAKNDLDRYFAEHLSKETRLKVMNQIAEMFKPKP